MILRGIQINPFKHQVLMFHRNFEIDALIYEMVGSYDVTQVRLTPTVQMFVDEMGPYRKGQAYCQLGAFPIPISGKALLLGYGQFNEDAVGSGRGDVPFTGTAIIENGITWLQPSQAHLLFPPPEGDVRMGFEQLPMPLIDISAPAARGDV